MVGGVAGAGKSTLVNHLMHHCLKMAGVEALTLTLTLTLT